MRLTFGATQTNRTRVSRVLAAAVLATALTGLVTGMVLAHNFGSNTAGYNTPAHPCDESINSQCVAHDRLQYTYFVISPTNPMTIATKDRFAVYNPTDVDFVETSCSVASCSDLWIFTGDYGDTSWWAYGNCSTLATYGGTDPDRWCNPQDIFYNITHPSNWDGTLTGRKAVACHELGHTVGLRHVGTGSCMVSGTKVLITIDTDARNHINSHY